MKKFITSNIFFLIILGIIVFAIYGKTIKYDLINLDDDTSISRNINFISKIENLPKLFLTDCLYNGSSIYYRPVLMTSFAAETILFGYNKKIYHLTNIFLFILGIYLTFLFFVKLKIFKDKNLLKFIIILFSVHPVFISNVSYISTRAEILLLIFVNLTFINFINYLDLKQKKDFILTILFFAFTIFTKESGIALIILLPLLSYCFKQEKSLKETSYIFISCFFILIPYYIMRKYSSGSIDIGEYIQIIPNIILNIINGITIYINKLFIPDYIPVILFNATPSLKECFVCSAFIIFTAIIFYKKIIERKIIFFGTAIFLSFLLPSFFMKENQIFFHRLLLPSTGLLLIFSFLLQAFTQKYNFSKKYFLYSFIILFILFSYSSFVQSDKYKNSLSFFENAYLDAPNYHLICRGLSKEYKAQKKYNEALLLTKKAYSLKNDISYAVGYAIILFKMGHINEAKNLFLQAASVENNETSLIYKYLSEISLETNNIEDAIIYAQKAVNLSSKIEKAHYYNELSRVYSIAGQYDKSINILLYLLKEDEDNADYYLNLSMLYEDLGEKEKAEECKKMYNKLKR